MEELTPAAELSRFSVDFTLAVKMLPSSYLVYAKDEDDAQQTAMNLLNRDLRKMQNNFDTEIEIEDLDVFILDLSEAKEKFKEVHKCTM